MLTLPGVVPTVGAAAYEVLHKSVCTPKRQKQQDPSSCLLRVYMAGDTLCPQPIGMGHMTATLGLGQ